MPIVFSVGANNFGSEGAQCFADMLKLNTTLTRVRKAARFTQSSPLVLTHSCEWFTASAPPDVFQPPRRFPNPHDVFRPWFSLYYNGLGSEGAEHLSGALKINTTITDLKCALN